VAGWTVQRRGLERCRRTGKASACAELVARNWSDHVAARPAAEAHPSDGACRERAGRAGLPTVLQAADHADLPHPVLDLGRSVGNEAVLAVERLCSRVRVGHPQRRRLVRIEDRLQQR
jgi:hypothetical protein